MMNSTQSNEVKRRRISPPLFHLKYAKNENCGRKDNSPSLFQTDIGKNRNKATRISTQNDKGRGNTSYFFILFGISKIAKI